MCLTRWVVPCLHPVQPDLHGPQRRLLRRKALLAPSRIGPSMHPSGPLGEGLRQVSRSAEPMPDPPSPKGEPITPTETLRFIGKVVALPTCEVPVSSIEYGAAAVALGARKPAAATAEVLIGVDKLDPGFPGVVVDQHALASNVNRYPRARTGRRCGAMNSPDRPYITERQAINWVQARAQ